MLNLDDPVQVVECNDVSKISWIKRMTDMLQEMFLRVLLSKSSCPKVSRYPVRGLQDKEIWMGG